MAQPLYGDDNVFKQFLIRKGHAADAELEAAFAAAAQVIEGDYCTSPQEQMYIEPQAMMAALGRRAPATSSARCSARTTCTRR